MEKYLITKNVNIIKQNLLNKLLLAGYKIILMYLGILYFPK